MPCRLALSAVIPLFALALIGCQDGPTAATVDQPLFEIKDAVHNEGNPHFFFLPPMVGDTVFNGDFDGTQSPIVEICEWEEGLTGSCIGNPIATFTTGTSGGFIQVDTETESYGVPWHAADYTLQTEAIYRIRVSVGQQELGHADVQPMSNGSELKDLDTGQLIGLVEHRTLMIRFRIEDGALGITIDATGLSTSGVDLWGPEGSIGSFPTADIIRLPGHPGSYAIFDRSGGSPVPFSVTDAGALEYDNQYDPIFAGRGSPTLVVLGNEYTVNATALSALTVHFSGIGTYPKDTPVSLTALPGVKAVQDQSGGWVHYELTTDGFITYGPEVEPYVDGLNTKTLTLVGYDYTVNATALSALTVHFTGTGTFPTGTPVLLTAIPSVKAVHDQSGGWVHYELTTDGFITYAPEAEPYVDGLNTKTLTLVGYEIHVDATLMTPQTFTVGGVGSFSTTSVELFVFVPGVKSFITSELSFNYTVSALGKLDYDSAMDSRVSGRGGDVLTILY